LIFLRKYVNECRRQDGEFTCVLDLVMDYAWVVEVNNLNKYLHIVVDVVPMVLNCSYVIVKNRKNHKKRKGRVELWF